MLQRVTYACLKRSPKNLCGIPYADGNFSKPLLLPAPQRMSQRIFAVA